MIARVRLKLLAFVILLLAAIVSPAKAADTGSDSKTIDNVAIYMGLLPAQMARGHLPSHAESTMHGGVPAGRSEYHVVIALFDATTGKRISGADIRARVAEIGLSGEEKKLNPMEIAGTETYGNYFPMTGNGPFQIFLTIRVPGHQKEIKTEFEHKHR